MAKTYEQTLTEEIVRVPWLGGETGRALAGAIGKRQDAEDRALKDAVLMKCPSLAPVDALPLLAVDRMLRRAPVESNAALALRLDQAQDIWDSGGTAAGIAAVFAPYGFTSATVQVLRNCQVSGNWDGNEGWHSRVFVFLDSTSGPFHTDGNWEEDPGSDVWSEDENGDTWDSSATVPDLRYFRASVRDLKSDDAYPVTIAVWLPGVLPDGYWDSPGGEWPEDDGDAGGAVWAEDGSPLYWTLGNVWGQEAWLSGGVDNWVEGAEDLVTVTEADEWVAFPGEEI